MRHLLRWQCLRCRMAVFTLTWCVDWPKRRLKYGKKSKIC
nr:MAG TPA: hypothetical protein [Caudoviricetes sp.]